MSTELPLRSTAHHVYHQRAYATISGDRIAELDVLCSGVLREQASTGRAADRAGSAPPAVSALLDGGKADCATLTPLVKAKLRDLESGQVLEVISGEPSAEQDIAS